MLYVDNVLITHLFQSVLTNCKKTLKFRHYNYNYKKFFQKNYYKITTDGF